VLKEQGGLGNEDDSVYVPLTTAQSRFFTQRTLSGEQPVAAIYASVISEDQVDAAEEQITTLLRERHNLASDAPDDFRVTSQQAILDIAGQITGILTLFLGAIAGISLLVGGIGIMNIMLVSVTERTARLASARRWAPPDVTSSSSSCWKPSSSALSGAFSASSSAAPGRRSSPTSPIS